MEVAVQNALLVFSSVRCNIHVPFELQRLFFKVDALCAGGIDLLSQL